MARYTESNQKEDLSEIKFREFLYPWDCTRINRDVGIDLLVQPFEERFRNTGDKSLNPFRKSYFVQLKSTSCRMTADNNSITIDTEHLVMWKEREETVMIAQYYIEDQCFYYAWANEVIIKEENKYQTISLNYRLDYPNRAQVKEEILGYLSPIVIIPGDLKFDPLNPNKMELIEIVTNYRSGEQLNRLFTEGRYNKTAEKLVLENEIYNLKLRLVKEPSNHELYYHLVVCYIRLKKFSEAAKELGVVIYHFKVPEAKILFSIIQSGHTEIFESLTEFRFDYYLKWVQNCPEGTQVKCFIKTIKGDIYDLPYCESGSLIPTEDLLPFQIKFILERPNTDVDSPSVNMNVSLLRVMLDKHGDPLFNFAEVIDLK